MKVPQKTILTVVVASAGLSQADAFAPAASFARKSGVGPAVMIDGRLASSNRNRNFLTTVLSTPSPSLDEELEIKLKENSGWSKLTKLKDFDNGDEDEKKVIELLDAAIEFLEVEVAKDSSFATALRLVRLLRDQVAKIRSIDFSTYTPNPEFPNVDLSGLMKKMDGGPPINQIFGPSKIVRLIRRLTEVKLAVRRQVSRQIHNAKSEEAAYKSSFTEATIGVLGVLPNPFRNVLPEPAALDNWDTDEEFARQFFCGTNPVMIEVAKNPEKQLSKNLVNHFGKDKLQELADKNQLLFVSYDDLADLKVNPHQAFPLPQNNKSGPDSGPAPQEYPQSCYAPIVAFVYDNEKDELDVLGIQLERTDDARIYTKNNSGENEWLFVKCQVLAADSNMHEWVSHLGNTHLTMEPHIIAIYNTLRQVKHPLYTFLKQISRDTLLLNWGARETLASYNALSFGDYQSSVGVGQFMQLIDKMWSRYSFFEKTSLPNELASRGFTEDVHMPAYLYREDGMKLWNAIGVFAKDFVDEIYDSDAAVASDEAVQEWAKETTDPDKGAIKGFPTSFKDKETVVKVLQTLMWMTSGLHAAVNFPQYEAYGFVPNKPLAVRADLNTLPENDAEIRKWMFENMFPVIRTDDEWLSKATGGHSAAIDMLETARLLTTPSLHCLDNLSDEFATIGTKAYAKFLKNLNVISEEINARNEEAKKANKAPYNYLNPSNVPASIDI